MCVCTVCMHVLYVCVCSIIFTIANFEEVIHFVKLPLQASMNITFVVYKYWSAVENIHLNGVFFHAGIFLSDTFDTQGQLAWNDFGGIWWLHCFGMQHVWFVLGRMTNIVYCKLVWSWYRCFWWRAIVRVVVTYGGLCVWAMWHFCALKTCFISDEYFTVLKYIFKILVLWFSWDFVILFFVKHT